MKLKGGTSWGSIYRYWLSKGHDHGSAAEKADAWEKRSGAAKRKA